jgi:hypothetical protein
VDARSGNLSKEAQERRAATDSDVVAVRSDAQQIQPLSVAAEP